MFTMRHRGRLSKLRIAARGYNADAERRGDRYVLTSMNRFCSMLRLADDTPEEARRMVADATWDPPIRPSTRNIGTSSKRGAKLRSMKTPSIRPARTRANVRRATALGAAPGRAAKAVALWLRGRLALATGGPDAPRH